MKWTLGVASLGFSRKRIVFSNSNQQKRVIFVLLSIQFSFDVYQTNLKIFRKKMKRSGTVSQIKDVR